MCSVIGLCVCVFTLTLNWWPEQTRRHTHLRARAWWLYIPEVGGTICDLFNDFSGILAGA